MLHLTTDSDHAVYTDDQRDGAFAGETIRLGREYYPDLATDPEQLDSAQAQLCHIARVWVRQCHDRCPVIDARARLAEIAVERARLGAEEETLHEELLARCTYVGW